MLKLADSIISPDQWAFDFSFPKEKGNPNPHLWLNVEYAMRYAELVRDELSEIDPSNADYYASNTERYLTLLRQLDKRIMQSIQTIPPENRKLITYHDAWPYFAKRYDLEIVGVAQPSHFGEPTDKKISKIIEQVRAEGIPVIFASEVFPSSVTDRIATEEGVEIVETLRDDALPGSMDSPDHTYVGMMLANVSTMVTSLGGDATVLDEVNPSNTYAAP